MYVWYILGKNNKFLSLVNYVWTKIDEQFALKRVEQLFYQQKVENIQGITWQVPRGETSTSVETRASYLNCYKSFKIIVPITEFHDAKLLHWGPILRQLWNLLHQKWEISQEEFFWSQIVQNKVQKLMILWKWNDHFLVFHFFTSTYANGFWFWMIFELTSMYIKWGSSGCLFCVKYMKIGPWYPFPLNTPINDSDLRWMAFWCRIQFYWRWCLEFAIKTCCEKDGQLWS